jgi:hypothetical protein
MEARYEDFSPEKLAQALGKSDRLFDVAYDTLLRISDESFPLEQIRQAVNEAIALIQRYPNDERYLAGYKPKKRCFRNVFNSSVSLVKEAWAKSGWRNRPHPCAVK